MLNKEEYIFLKQLMKQHLDNLDITEVDKETIYYQRQLGIYEKLIQLSKDIEVD